MRKYLIHLAGKLANKIIADKYYSIRFEQTDHVNCSLELENINKVDIITIAFNNSMVIKNQLLLIRKYLNEPYEYTVIDNSPDPKANAEIKEICVNFNAGYIRLPKNPYTKLYTSLSHGAALNWVYRNYISKRCAKYFGFIDHDLFPIRPTEIRNKMRECQLFGFVVPFMDKWMLWPGFCFYEYESVKDKNPNFMPLLKAGLDTGGANWPILYSNINMSKVWNASYIEKPITFQDKTFTVQYIGEDWIHTGNASSYFIDSKKDSFIENIYQELTQNVL